MDERHSSYCNGKCTYQGLSFYQSAAGKRIRNKNWIRADFYKLKYMIRTKIIADPRSLIFKALYWEAIFFDFQASNVDRRNLNYKAKEIVREFVKFLFSQYNLFPALKILL